MASQSAILGVAASEVLLDEFERGILARMSEVLGRPVTAAGAGRTHKGRAGQRANVTAQPWYSAACVATKQAWHALHSRGASLASVVDAWRIYHREVR